MIKINKLLKIKAFNPIRMEHLTLRFKSIEEAKFNNPGLIDFEVVG